MHSFERFIAVIIGAMMAFVGLALGVTIVGLPVGIIVGLVGIGILVGGLFGG